MVMVITPRCRYTLPMEVVDGRYVLLMDGKCGDGDWWYLPLDISGRVLGEERRRKQTTKFRGSLRYTLVGHLPSSSSLPPSSSLCHPSSSSSSSSSSRLSPHPSSVSPLLLFLIVVSSSGFARRRHCCFSPCCWLGLPCLLPSPHFPSSETNPPTSLWKGEGWIGLQPHL